ncbi:MAG: response regulator transcription factor [Elusimicrobiota bacterium]|nr:response regulator transcription factor [Elusimicrobiota bacterium]
MRSRIALVEPDLSLARSLAALLEEEGYGVTCFPTLGRFFDAIAKQRPNAVLLNMQLQGMEGREILRALRANPGTKVTVLIGLSENEHCKDEAVAAFTAGADEYFFKPLDTQLLIVRLRSLITRAPARPEEEMFQVAGITVCPATHTCTVNGDKVLLTKLEFGLLLQFIRNPQRVLTRGNLIDALWRGDPDTGGRAVDRHISALRAKLGADGRLLETVVGVGYRLVSGSSK